MGLPAKHERYPEVARICRVIPSSASKRRFLWAFTEAPRLQASLGELRGAPRGGSFLRLKVKFLLLSLTQWAQSPVSWAQFASSWVFPWALASVAGISCLLAGDRGQALPLIHTLMPRIGTKWASRAGSTGQKKICWVPLLYNWPCIITTKKILLWKLGHRGGNVPPPPSYQTADKKQKSDLNLSHFLLNPGSQPRVGEGWLVPVIPAFE